MAVTSDTLAEVRASPLFSDFSDEELEKLAESMDLVRFAKGQSLFEEDSAGSALFVIYSGQVGVTRKTAKERTRERLLAVVGAGECVGEMALVDGGTRSATVMALDAVEALQLSTDSYQAMREGDPKLAIKMALGVFRLLSKRLRQINKSLEIVHYWMFA